MQQKIDNESDAVIRQTCCIVPGNNEVTLVELSTHLSTHLVLTPVSLLYAVKMSCFHFFFWTVLTLL